MPYNINLTSGTVLNTNFIQNGSLADGVADSTTGITLVGKNYIGYGQAQNTNFIRLLENFADTISPVQSLNATSVLTGTLWFDTGNKVLKVYDGLTFNNVSGRVASSTIPEAVNVGDQWWDTVNLQLNTWTGSTWQVIGSGSQNADLAENYSADANYAPGTVVVFGGEKEITQSTKSADVRVAGVISTNPAYLMNRDASGLPVALRGRVPCQVVGPVAKGDGLVTSGTIPGCAVAITDDISYPRSVFAKSLVDDNNTEQRIIEVVII
jgi:hypothetical protein